MSMREMIALKVAAGDGAFFTLATAGALFDIAVGSGGNALKMRVALPALGSFNYLALIGANVCMDGVGYQKSFIVERKIISHPDYSTGAVSGTHYNLLAEGGTLPTLDISYEVSATVKPGATFYGDQDYRFENEPVIIKKGAHCLDIHTNNHSGSGRKLYQSLYLAAWK